MIIDQKVAVEPAQFAEPLRSALFAQMSTEAWWTDAMLAAADIPVEDVAVALVGGGIGSFVTADYLRVAGGLSTQDIRIVSNLATPWQKYEQLARVSQIPPRERIRSDSASRPDNLWGFPSYALQEALRARTLTPLAQVLVEPIFTGYYTPRLGMVLTGIEREAKRINYWDMLIRSEVMMVRRRVGGGYFVALASPGRGVPDRALRCRDVHLALGYAGLSYQPEIQQLRLEENDFHHAVNAYEDHEHVYEALRRRPGKVIVRGGGIVASRVLERLITDRQRHGLQTEVIHLLRTYVDGSHGPHPWARRRGGYGFAYQGFNYPKSAWGGQLWAQMRRREGSRRARLYEQIGGTTTARRRSWERQQRAARQEGWYSAVAGTIEHVAMENGRLLTRVVSPEAVTDFRTDFLIDCTGLTADVRSHRVLRDLLEHGGAQLNPLNRMDVARTFELRGTRSGMGRLYLSGAAALGGYFPGVDTFLGLQIAAQEIVDDMADRGHCRKLGPIRSVLEWIKWSTGKQI
jgi:hypothetical protein